MVQTLMICLSIPAVLLLGAVVTMDIHRDGLAVIRPSLAQTTPTSSGNMTDSYDGISKFPPQGS